MKFFRLLLPTLLTLALLQTTKAQTVPPELASLLTRKLDSMRTVLNVKSLGAALQLPNNAVWASAKGISSLIPLDSVTPEHAYEIGSITKTITAACILQLADEGVLGLDDSLHQWLPAFPFVNPNITIRQLLRHQSGLYDVITNPAYNTASTSAPDSIWDLENLVTDYIKAPLFQPGASWSYSNTNYVLLGLIIKAATGNPYYTEYRNRFFEPLNLSSAAIPPYESLPLNIAHVWLDLNGDGITDDAHWFFSNWNSFFTSAGPAGGYFETPTDVAIWMKAFMSGSLHTPGTMAQAKTTVATGMPGNTKYGLGLMERKYLGLTGYGHGGDIGYSSTSFYFPARDVSIAVLNNDSKNNSWTLAPVVQELLRAYLAYQSTTGVEASLEPEQLAMSVYPNPFLEDVEVAVNLPVTVIEAQLVLTNVVGESVAQTSFQTLSKGNQTMKLEQLKNLSSGVYFLSIVLDGTVVKTMKLIK